MPKAKAEPFWEHCKVNTGVLFPDRLSDADIALAGKDPIHFTVNWARDAAVARLLTRMITDTTLEVYEP